MTTIKCLECPMEQNDWEKMFRHKEATGHRFTMVDDREVFDREKLTPKDYSDDKEFQQMMED